jgi:hypothetical protein
MMAVLRSILLAISLPVANLLAQTGVQAQGARAAVAETASVAQPSATAKSTKRVLQATRILRAPEIDGRLSEAAWTGGEAGRDFVQVHPRSGAPATERTEATILYDDNAIYVGVRMFDSRPDSIVSRLGRRDEPVYSDWFSVQIDSYHDGRTAFGFAVNPRGVKRDAFMYDDTRSDGTWDAVWDVATHTDSLGWTAEFRIPVSQLRFSAPSDSTIDDIWGINFQRYIARRDERSNWSPIPKGSGQFVSLFGELHKLYQLQGGQRLEVVPYSLVRLTQAPGDARNPFYEKNALLSGLGADVKYRPTSNLTLTATLNPDFGQVEADAAVVNLSAYETFYPEKRRFFIERSDLFQFGVSGTQLFYSRRIGRRPQRTIAALKGFVDAPAVSTVFGAAKLTGRTKNGWQIGVLDAVTGAESARVRDSTGGRRIEPTEPLTNYAALRLGRNFNNGQSGANGFFTATNRRLADTRLDFLRSAAYSGGFNVRHRFDGGNYELSGSALGSLIMGSTGAISRVQTAPGHYFQRPDAKHLHFDSARTSLTGAAGSLSFARIGGAHWTWGTGGTVISPGFEVNDLGYQRAADALLHNSYVNYNQSEPGRLLRSWDVGVNEWSAWTFGGERTSTGAGVNVGFLLPNYWGTSLGVSQSLDALATDALWGGPGMLAPGRTDGWLSLYGDGRRSLSFQLFANASREASTGSRALGAGASVQLRPLPGMDVSLGPYLYWGKDAAQYLGQQAPDGESHHLFARVDQTNISLPARINITFTPTVSLQVFAQPFIGSAAYSEIKEARVLRAHRFSNRFYTFAGEQIRHEPESLGYYIDLDGNGDRETYVYDPSFNTKSLNSNTVLRWEYRPGSSLFVVWTQGRSDYVADGSFNLERDAARLFGTGSNPQLPTTNVIAIKASFWFGR